MLLIFNNKTSINVNLMNGVMLIHPYILYFFYAIFINLILIVSIDLFFLKSKQTTIRVKSKKNLISTFFLCTVLLSWVVCGLSKNFLGVVDEAEILLNYWL